MNCEWTVNGPLTPHKRPSLPVELGLKQPLISEHSQKKGIQLVNSIAAPMTCNSRETVSVFLFLEGFTAT